MGARNLPGFPHLQGSSASWSGTPEPSAGGGAQECSCAVPDPPGPWLGDPQSLIGLSMSCCWALFVPGQFPCALHPLPACAPLHVGSPGVTWVRRQGSAWVLARLALPTLALSVAHDLRTVCKMSVRVVPHPVCHGIHGAPCTGALPTRTHFPQSKHHPGGCRGSLSAHQVTEGPRDIWHWEHWAWCSSAMPQVCRSHKPSVCTAGVPLH